MAQGSGQHDIYHRSSGPGGQNVNRLNTKATVRLDMSKCTSAKPAVSQSLDMSPGSRWLLKDVADDLIKESPYYVQSSHTVAISSMRHRTAPANAQDALEKLHEHLMGIGSASLVGETSDEQRRRVKNLQRKESRKMEQVKRKRSDTKAGRGKVSLG
ncbi:hypothetical protein OC845_003949 [Tilletia horrida]|nr:hypothetical protein OC845_003949 [Tilletia horrida]